MRYAVLIFLGFLIKSSTFANTVNILSWWGYANNPQIQNLVKKSCKINLSIDSYYSDNEFLDRIKLYKNTYDIVIFSNTIANLIKSEIKLNKSSLKYITDNYLGIIKNNLLRANYPDNFYIYGLTVSGILYSRLEINNSAKYIILDDPIEGPTGIKILKKYNKNINYKNLYITNGYNKIYQQGDFTAAFIWAGDAIENIKKHHNFKFQTDPEYSRITYDILAHLNDYQSTMCATKVLLSKKAQEIMQNNDFYLSPLDINIKDQEIFKKFKFLDNISEKQYHENNIKWIKLKTTILNSKND